MEPWVTALVTTIISALGAFGVFGYLGKRWLDKYFQKKEDKERRLSEAEEIKRHEEESKLEKMIITSIKGETDPINDKLEKIANGTLDTLRDRILSCYYKCVEKGYRTDYDYQNIHHMNVDYLALNGNSYVEDVMKRFDALPTKEDYEKEHKKKKKQPLVENK